MVLCCFPLVVPRVVKFGGPKFGGGDPKFKGNLSGHHGATQTAFSGRAVAKYSMFDKGK